MQACGCELFSLESFTGWGSERFKQTSHLKEASQSTLIDYHVTDAAIAHDACFYDVKQRGEERGTGREWERKKISFAQVSYPFRDSYRRAQRKHKQERAFVVTFMRFTSTDVSIAVWATITILQAMQHCKITWCLTSTETIRLIRDGRDGEGGMEV